MAMNSIWVVVDRQGDAVAPASLELLTAATAMGGAVAGVTWGDGASLAASAGSHGAATLCTIGDLGAALPGPAMARAMAAQVGSGNVPDVILAPHNYDGRDIVARLSVLIDRPVLTNVVDLHDDPGAGGLVADTSIFGGTHTVRSRFTGPGPGIFTVRAKSFAAEAGHGGPARVSSWEAGDLSATGGARVVERHVEEAGGPKLDEAPVVVAGGRGLGDAQTFALVEQLAKLLHGAAGASRAIVDAGWVPYAHQVGQTGRTVKPELYLAVGISGATQHLVGMNGSKTIVAINKDREAPIFSICDLGVVGDVHQVLPRLIEALQARL